MKCPTNSPHSTFTDFPPGGRRLAVLSASANRYGLVRFSPYPFTSFTDFPPGGRRLAVLSASANRWGFCALAPTRSLRSRTSPRGEDVWLLRWR